MATIQKSQPALLVEIQGGYIFEDAPPEIREKILQTTELIRSMGYKFHRPDGNNFVCIPSPAAQSPSETASPRAGDP